MGTSKADNEVSTNHLVVPMKIEITINKFYPESGEATSLSPPHPLPPCPSSARQVTDKASRVKGSHNFNADGVHVLATASCNSNRKSAAGLNQDGNAASPSPPPSLPLPPPHSPSPRDVTKTNFRVGWSYHVLSADGEHVLSASNRETDRESKFGGFRMDFLEDRLWKPRDDSALFRFSGHPGAYRMHSRKHHDNMLYFCGAHHQLDWVVWKGAVPTNGKWEVMEICWLADGSSPKRFKIKFFEGFFVKWAVSGFTGVKEWEAATEFVLREI